MSQQQQRNLQAMQMSQKVTFSEDIGSVESFEVWESGVITILSHEWSLKLLKSEESDAIDFRIKYNGPNNTCELQQIVVIFGIDKRSGVVEVMNKNLRFVKYEARMVRNLINFSRLSNMISKEGGLMNMSVKLSANNNELNRLQSKVIELTNERNTLHKSLQKISMTDSDVAFLNDAIATQPEVARQYEAFKAQSKPLIFGLLNQHTPEYFGDLLTHLTRRIDLKLKQKRKTQSGKILSLLGLEGDVDKVSPVAREAVEAGLRSIFRGTQTALSVEALSSEDKETVKAVIADSKEISKQEGGVEFGYFVWAIQAYLFCNPQLFVNWEAIGSYVAFDRAKHKSIDRRVRAGETCVVAIPMLQKKPGLSLAGANPRVSATLLDDFEPLCTALVCPQ